MRSLAMGTSGRLRTLVGLLIAAFALAEVQPAQAQYQYQPAPDYYHNDTASGTFMGGALGAVTGAIVGGRKDRGEGALIGAGIGAVTGNLLGRSKDRSDEQRAAAGAAAVGQLNQQAQAAAVTNYDLLEMTRAGVSEDVIISTMRSRGARIDLSPQAIITLKQQGVGDRVLVAAQNMSTAPNYVPGAVAPVTVVRDFPPPTTVIVEPYRPYCYPHYHYYHHHHHRRHGHGHLSIGF